MKAETWLLGVLGFVVVLVTLLVTSDLALARSAPNNPYGPLWFLLNPLYFTQWPYRIYLAGFELTAYGCMLWAFERWTLPFRVALLQLVVALLFAVLGWTENVTVIGFAWAAWYAWPLVLLSVQKFPVGWSWDLRDAHVACLHACYIGANGSHPSVLGRDMLHTVVYGLLILVVTYPLIVRISGMGSLKAYISWLYRVN